MNLNFLVTLEIFSIIMLIVITWKQDSSKLFHCSRDRSKIVRDVIYKKFIPIFVRHKTALSHECPFHPDRDILWWPHSSDIQHQQQQPDHSMWTCPFCGIDFHCNERLIFHWDQEHRYSQQYKEDLVCLADYCGIFRCDIILKKMLNHKKRFLNYLPFGKSINSDNQPTNNLQQCDNGQMILLQEMCNNVIQQCTIGIELNVSNQFIWTLRKELSESLCSYLTCEHYYDDIFTEEISSHKVPIILFSIVGFIMLGGFILLYYLIWNAIKRGLVLNDYHPEDNLEQKNDDTFTKSELKSGQNNNRKELRKTSSMIHSNDSNHYHHHRSDRFFENIFEFNHEKYDYPFEFNDDDFDKKTNVVTKFKQTKSKLHPINSIIEEEEEESERDINVNSYPNIGNRRNFKRNLKTTKSSTPTQSVSEMATLEESSNNNNNKQDKLKKQSSTSSSQEICLQDLPMKFHSKYIQPLKHSYSDQYPCYTGPMSENFSMLSNKSRSYSHTQLKNIPHHHLQQQQHQYPQSKNPRMLFANPRRQLSMEEWTTNINSINKNPEMHSIHVLNTKQYAAPPPAPSSLPSNSRSIDWNHGAGRTIISTSGGDRPRISKSAMSYHMMHPKKRREIYASSKTNSDASIASGSSRYTAISNPTTTSYRT